MSAMHKLAKFAIPWMRSEKNIVRSKPLHEAIEKCSLGKLFYECLKHHYRNESLAMYDIATDESVTFQELFTLSCKLAIWMKDEGVRQGDVILIYSPNRWEYFVPVLAAFYNCYIVANANSILTKNEMEHIIRLTKPKIIFGTYAAMEILESLKLTLRLNRIVFLDGLRTLLDNVQLDISSFEPKDCNIRKQTAVIMFSSGTTGLTKGVKLTHKNYLTRFVQAEDPAMAPTTSGNLLLFPPFSHVLAFTIALSYLLKGQSFYYMQKFSLSLLLATIAKRNITALPVVPTVMVMLAKHPNIDTFNLSSVRYILCAGAPLGRGIEEATTKIFPNAHIWQGYGLTECTCFITSFRLSELGRKPGSCGTALPGVKLIVRCPDSGKSLGPNQVGELYVKSGTVMKGYIRNAKATRASITFRRWLRTGDLVYYDEDKYFYVVDRLKEVIKYKALQVVPAELEALLLTHPKIQDAAVVGKADELAGEMPLAFLVKQPAANVTSEEICEFVAKQVAVHKCLTGGVRFIDEIPKSQSGKILRIKLREILKNETSNQS